MALHYLAFLALLLLLVICAGAIHLQLSRKEIFDYDRQRIQESPMERRKAIYCVLGMAALGGASAAGMLVLLFRI